MLEGFEGRNEERVVGGMVVAEVVAAVVVRTSDVGIVGIAGIVESIGSVNKRNEFMKI